MTTDWKLILGLAGGFVFGVVVVVFILKRLLRAPAESAARRLKKIHEENLEHGLRLKQKLDRAERDYRKRIEDASQTGHRIKKIARRDSEEMKDKIMQQAEYEKKEIIFDAREESELIKGSVLLDQKLKVVDLTENILTHVFGDGFEAWMHNYFVDRVCEELGNLDLSKINVSQDSMKITSARLLSDDQRKRLREIISEKLGQDITITEYEKDPSFIAGVHIKLGDLVIDGTMRNKVKQSLSNMKSEIRAEGTNKKGASDEFSTN
ncbi:MAG: F0F1 ATP synthase subunit delta [Planctomycetes bacterium]|nr:F0F1 ATP synthase subunit delta [Planctomycetota bacterium]